LIFNANGEVAATCLVNFYFVLSPYEVPPDDKGAYDVSPFPFVQFVIFLHVGAGWFLENGLVCYY